MRICTVFFSPTGTTRRVVNAVRDGLIEAYGENCTTLESDITLPIGRQEILQFSEKDIVVAGVPVYAGRVPNLIVPYIKTLQGNGAEIVCLVCYGNRHYDDALLELVDIMETNRFRIRAAAAAVGQHSFSDILAFGRPDKMDNERLQDFGKKIGKSFIGGIAAEHRLPGNRPYRAYYQPKDSNGHPVDFKSIKPETLDTCTDCKLCAKSCPLGSIDFSNVSNIPDPCIKCCACVKACPVSAKIFSSEIFIRHRLELEERCIERKEIETFI